MRNLVKISLVSLSILIWVGTASATNWSVPGDFDTIQDAVDSPDVVAGDSILVGKGSHAGALVDKQVSIKGTGKVVIDDGPLHPAGLTQGFRMLSGSAGTTISNLEFRVDLAVMNSEAVDNVTIDHCTFTNALQAVSNWGGCGWTISHNDINGLRTRNGGGIGILVADRSGGVVENNVVSHNDISGTLYVNPSDGGGYSGTGIVIYADFRWNMAGASAIRNNTVTDNKVSLTSDTPDVVDVVAFELTDTRDDESLEMVVYDNAIGYNDFRGTTIQISLTPDNLDEWNDISRNLGDNRGHGDHPSAFRPNN